MIDQINFSIVLIFVSIIIGCVLLLLLATPGVIREYKQIAVNKKLGIGSPNSMNTGLTIYMEELSRCTNIDRIKVLKQEIAKTTTEIENQSTNKIHLHQTISVKKWLEHFSINQHLKDLKTLKISQQIQFDSAKKDFKLMIVK